MLVKDDEVGDLIGTARVTDVLDHIVTTVDLL